MSKTLYLNVQLLNLAVSVNLLSPQFIKFSNFILRKKRKIYKLTLSTAEKRHKRALSTLSTIIVTEISLQQTNRGFLSRW